MLFRSANTGLINPWVLGYTGVEFDIKPTEENAREILNMAFNNLDIENPWDEQDIQGFVSFVLEDDKYYLAIDDSNTLMYGYRNNYSGWEYIKWIKYSMLINNGLNENKKEDDGFNWARETKLTFGEDNLPRVGDVLICLPGYHSDASQYGYRNEADDPECAGFGYAEGRIVVVGEVLTFPHNPEEKRIVIWPDLDKSAMYWDYSDDEGCFDCGIYGFALTYYTGTINEIGRAHV